MRLRENSVAILGAGPTGLGAAHRLTEIGHAGVRLFDQNPYAGGLAASFVDQQGFTWDIGGHVLFSHYKYFDNLMDRLLGNQWLEHLRESWVWMRNRFIAYPLQNNVHMLPAEEFKACMAGFVECRSQSLNSLLTFRDWIEAGFGAGFANAFMLPYNFKVWAHDPSTMSYQWIGERVATVDVARILENARHGKQDCGWGPNHRFRFPLRGGTGQIWRTLAGALPQGVFQPGKGCVRIETARRTLHFGDGSKESYDKLVSTIPLDVLISISDLDWLKPAAGKFRYSTVHVVGIGLSGSPPPHLKTKCWMYFPESNCPFYRATVFSNYSPHNVPDIRRNWSLMVEVSESPYKPVDRAAIVGHVVDGLLATRLIESRQSIASIWTHVADHGYPTPFLGRDELIAPILKEFEALDIYSRGRFGGWKYEVSNQDHSLMQGVELVDRLAFDKPEITYWSPNTVNGVKN